MILWAHWGIAFFALGGAATVLLLLAYPVWKEKLDRAVLTCAALSLAGALLLFVASHQIPGADAGVATVSEQSAEPVAFPFTAVDFLKAWNQRAGADECVAIRGIGGYDKVTRAYSLDFNREDFSRVVETMLHAGLLEGHPEDYKMRLRGELTAEQNDGRIAQITLTAEEIDSAHLALMRRSAITLIALMDPQLHPDDAADIARAQLRIGAKDETSGPPRSVAVGSGIISYLHEKAHARLTARPAQP